MKQSAYDRAKDAKVADTSEERDDRGIPLRCVAMGCPNRWAVDKSGTRLCNPHAWSESWLWPRITQEQLGAHADRAMERQFDGREPIVKTLSFAERRALLQSLKGILSEQKNPRGWIEKLRAKRARGEDLSAAQRYALKNLERWETA